MVLEIHNLENNMLHLVEADYIKAIQGKDLDITLYKNNDFLQIFCDSDEISIQYSSDKLIYCTTVKQLDYYELLALLKKFSNNIDISKSYRFHLSAENISKKSNREIVDTLFGVGVIICFFLYYNGSSIFLVKIILSVILVSFLIYIFISYIIADNNYQLPERHIENKNDEWNALANNRAIWFRVILIITAAVFILILK